MNFFSMFFGVPMKLHSIEQVISSLGFSICPRLFGLTGFPQNWNFRAVQ